MFIYAVSDTGGKEKNIGVLPIAKRTKKYKFEKLIGLVDVF